MRIKILTSAFTVIAAVGFTGIAKADQNVYRLYNPKTGNHTWTWTASYQQSLLSKGWKNEGVQRGIH